MKEKYKLSGITKSGKKRRIFVGSFNDCFNKRTYKYKQIKIERIG